MHKINKLIIISLTAIFIFAACKSIPANAPDSSEVVIPVQSSSNLSIDTTLNISPNPLLEEKLFSDEEVNAIARTLSGECYNDKLEDKRKVAEVILNRVSSNGFGDSVIEVVSAKGQFCGYWKQSRPVSESDIQIAEETLTEWYLSDREPLSDYLFFCAGSNRENIFRTGY